MHPAYFLKAVAVFVSLFIGNTLSFAGNTPCTATSLPNDMTNFQTYSNLGNTNSGVEDPGCGNYITADIWFSVTAPPNGLLDIVTLAGGLSDGAMAFYEGPCNDLVLLSCMDDDNCGGSIMPIMQWDNLSPGATYYIRIWAENGAPNGDFQIRVSNGPLPIPPIPTTALVGTAFMANVNGLDCVQLTTTTTGQAGCAWDPAQVDLSQPFDQTFNLNFGNSNSGADGICWVFQNNPSGLNACGTTGQQIAANINNSFIIEMDTYDNGPGFGDIAQDHISININGNMGNPVNGPNSLGDIEDGQDHEVRFVWNPATNSYEVYFDGNQVISGVYDIINNCLGGSSTCYWGFTGSTGGAVNDQTVCPVAPPPYPAGDELIVDVEICEGDSYYAGGANQTTSGTYVDFYIAANGCDSIVNTNLIVVPASTYEYDAAVCEGDCETVGGIPYCSSGTYQVTFPQGNYLGCDSIVTLNLTVLNPLAVIWPPEPVNCYSPVTILDGSLSTTGPGLVTYFWSGPGVNCITSGDGTPVVSVNCPGTYTLTVVQTLGNAICSASNTVTVEDQTSPPVADAGPAQNINCENTCVILDSGGSSTGQDITYSWTGPNGFVSSEPFPLVCEAGLYTLTVVNLSTGCLSSDFVEVAGDAQPPLANAEVSGEITCFDTSVTLDGSNSGGNGNLSYEWIDDNLNSISMEPAVSVNSSGNYTLIVTDIENGCTAETTVEVFENTEPPMADVTASGDLDCSVMSVTLNAENSSGTGIIEFEWLDENGISLGVDVVYETELSGAYSLIVTDQENGCTDEVTIMVNEDTTPPVSNAGPGHSLTCDSTSVTLDGTSSSSGATIEYEWLNAGGISVGTTATVEVSETGEYTLIVTDTTNHCTASSSVEVLPDDDLPVADAGQGQTLTCVDSTVTLDGNNSSSGNGISYEWLSPSNETIGTGQTIDTDSTGVYTLIVTNTANGCSASSTVEVDENVMLPVIDAGPNQLLTCVEEEAFLQGSGSGSGNLSFQWQNSQGDSIGASPSIIVDEPGIYTLILTDTDNGCANQAEVEVFQDTLSPVADAGSNGLLTCEVTEWILDGNGSSGDSLSFEWQNELGNTISSSATSVVTGAGTYLLLVTDMENGCAADAFVEVFEDVVPPGALILGDTILSCNDFEAVLEAGDANGNPDLEYEWQDETNTTIEIADTITLSVPGTYTLIVTDGNNGCTSMDIIEIVSDTMPPVINIGIPDTLTCTTTMVTYDAGNSSGNGSLQFEWLDSNGNLVGTEAEVELNTSGAYDLIVTDESNGCSAGATTMVFENTALPVADAGPETALTCDQTSAILDGSGTSASGDLSFEWQNDNTLVIGNTASVMVSETGIFTLIVTDNANGCTAQSTVEVTPDDNLPVLDVTTSASTLTCLETSAIINANATINGQSISYQWLNANNETIGSDSTITVEIPGIYTVIVTDEDNGCSVSSSLEILENTVPPQAVTGPDPTLTCEETSVLLDGASSTGFGTLAYQWIGPDNEVISSSVDVEVDQPGVYTLWVTSENGCTNSTQIEVFLDANVPVADAGTGGILDCAANSVALGGNGTSSGANFSYEWLDEGNTVIATTAVTSVSNPGIYTLQVLNTDNNCLALSSIEILLDVTPPVADAGVGGTLTCDSTEVGLGGPGTSLGPEFTYQWLNSNNMLVSEEPSFSYDQPDTYTLLVTNTQNACTGEAQVVIGQDIEMPFADAGPDGILTCDVTQLVLDGSNSVGSDLSFGWFDATGNLLGDQVELSVSQTGNYTLVVTNLTNGCSDSAMTHVAPEDNLPTVDLVADGILTCTNESVFLDGSASGSVSGNMGFEWQDASGNVLSTANQMEVLEPGDYILIVTDTDNGCTAFSSHYVGEDIEIPLADAGENQTITCDQTTVALIGNGSGGMSLSYIWLDENDVILANDTTISVSLPGVYELEVVNLENGCTSSETIEVFADLDLPLADVGPAEQLTCLVEETVLNGNGSSMGADFSYEWLDSTGILLGNELLLQVDQPGVYVLLVSDSSNGCEAQDQVTVAQDTTPPVAIIDETNPLNLDCNQTSLVLDGSASSPFGNLSFFWETSNGNILSDETTANPEVNASGIYNLTVTDLINGCTSTSSVFVDQDVSLPIVLINDPEWLTCMDTVVSIDATGSSNGDFTYVWTSDPAGGIISGTNSLEPVVNLAGTYTLTIIDNVNGCQSQGAIMVDEDVTPPVAMAAANGQFDCLTESVSLDGNGSSTGTGISYNWTGNGLVENASSLSPIVFQAGSYVLEVSNAFNGCTSTAEVVVIENPDVPNGLDYILEAPECFGDEGSLTIYATLGGEAPYLYSLDNGLHFTSQTVFNNLDPGTYTVLVQDATGCEYEEIIEIPAVPELDVEVVPEVQLNLGDTYQIDAQVNIPVSDIDTIIWSPSTGLSCQDCLNPVVDSLYQTTLFTVTVINRNGCVASDEIMVRLKKTREIYIPNAFSPHDTDGINDVFMIFAGHNKVKQVNSFRVFDRWGEIVYEAYDFQPNNPDFGWNGKLRDQLLNPAVFVYLAEIEFIDDVVELYKGDVTLMR